MCGNQSKTIWQWLFIDHYVGKYSYALLWIVPQDSWLTAGMYVSIISPRVLRYPGLD